MSEWSELEELVEAKSNRGSGGASFLIRDLRGRQQVGYFFSETVACEFPTSLWQTSLAGNAVCENIVTIYFPLIGRSFAIILALGRTVRLFQMSFYLSEGFPNPTANSLFGPAIADGEFGA